MTNQERSERAKRLLEDELFQAVMADIRERLVARIEALPPGDVDSQHTAALSLQLWKQVPAVLQQYAGDTAIEKHQAEQAGFMAKVRQKLRK